MKFPHGIEIGSVAIIMDDSGKFLLGLSTEGRGWYIPGGHIKPGESIVACLRREVREEIGCDINIITQLPQVEIMLEPKPGIGKHAIIFPFVVKLADNSKIKIDNVEFSKIKWVSLNKFSTDLFEHYQGIVPLLQNWIKTQEQAR